MVVVVVTAIVAIAMLVVVVVTVITAAIVLIVLDLRLSWGGLESQRFKRTKPLTNQAFKLLCSRFYFVPVQKPAEVTNVIPQPAVTTFVK